MQAAVSGAIDFSKAKFTDPGWWRRLNLVLRELLRQNNRTLIIERIRYHTALMAIPGVSQDTYQRCQEKASDGFDELVDSYRRPFGAREEKLDTANKLIELYKEEFGNPDDPEYAAQIDAAAAGILASRVSARS